MYWFIARICLHTLVPTWSFHSFCYFFLQVIIIINHFRIIATNLSFERQAPDVVRLCDDYVIVTGVYQPWLPAKSGRNSFNICACALSELPATLFAGRRAADAAAPVAATGAPPPPPLAPPQPPPPQLPHPGPAL